MNPEDYKAWKERIAVILKMDRESDKFIKYFLDWMDSIKGKKEAQLIADYHPDFDNVDSSNERVTDFIYMARFTVKNSSEYEFRLQSFDSAFFLYRPLLKAQWKDEMKAKLIENFTDEHFCNVDYIHWCKLRDSFDASIGLDGNVQMWEQQAGKFFIHNNEINACYLEGEFLEELQEVELFENKWYKVEKWN